MDFNMNGPISIRVGFRRRLVKSREAVGPTLVSSVSERDALRASTQGIMDCSQHCKTERNLALGIFDELTEIEIGRWNLRLDEKRAEPGFTLKVSRRTRRLTSTEHRYHGDSWEPIPSRK
jgi:hypothetical protein